MMRIEEAISLALRDRAHPEEEVLNVSATFRKDLGDGRSGWMVTYGTRSMEHCEPGAVFVKVYDSGEVETLEMM